MWAQARRRRGITPSANTGCTTPERPPNQPAIAPSTSATKATSAPVEIAEAAVSAASVAACLAWATVCWYCCSNAATCWRASSSGMLRACARACAACWRAWSALAGVARQQLPDRIDRGVVEGLRIGAGGAHLTLDRIERVGLREHRRRRLRDRLADAADRAGDAAEDAADQAAGRGRQQIEDQQCGECPGRQAVEGAGRRHGAAGHPGGDVAAGERGDDARDDPPDGGGDREGRRGRVVCARRVERGHPDPGAEHRQQDLDDQRDDDAGEDRAPRDAVDHDGVGVVVDGRTGTGCGGMRAGWIVHGRGGVGVLGQRL